MSGPLTFPPTPHRNRARPPAMWNSLCQAARQTPETTAHRGIIGGMRTTDAAAAGRRGKAAASEAAQLFSRAEGHINEAERHPGTETANQERRRACDLYQAAHRKATQAAEHAQTAAIAAR